MKKEAPSGKKKSAVGSALSGWGDGRGLKRCRRGNTGCALHYRIKQLHYHELSHTKKAGSKCISASRSLVIHSLYRLTSSHGSMIPLRKCSNTEHVDCKRHWRRRTGQSGNTGSRVRKVRSISARRRTQCLVRFKAWHPCLVCLGRCPRGWGCCEDWQPTDHE